LSCAKEAAKLGAKVICFDYVKPSPQGTTWGLGGTCVNVGCIPKKLMHHGGLMRYIALLLSVVRSSAFLMLFFLRRRTMENSKEFGYTVESKFEWKSLVDNVNNYIKGLNFSYKVCCLSGFLVPGLFSTTRSVLFALCRPV
jgi:thioredoxin reductase (NADPH)